jgi:hypothetical protein
LMASISATVALLSSSIQSFKGGPKGAPRTFGVCGRCAE